MFCDRIDTTKPANRTLKVERTPKKERKRQARTMARYGKTGALLGPLLVISMLAFMSFQSERVAANEEVGEPDGKQEISSSQLPLNESSSHKNRTIAPMAKMPQANSLPLETDPRKPSRGRQSRIYRIRATGSNGSFAGSVMRLNPPVVVSTEEPAEPKFGSRQQTNAKLVTNPGAQPKATQQQQQQQQQKSCSSPAPPVAAEAETAAEASSISASSQTLRLVTKPTTQPQLVTGQRGAGGAGELDESLLVSQSGVAALNEPQPVEPVAAQAERTVSTFASGQPRSVESILNLIDEFDSKITTNKTEAQLSCDSGEMVIRLNFTEPFRGVVYPDHDRLSPCRFFGDGHHNYELRLPLKGCGTRQVAARVFVNDVIVRFHKTLELEEDEVKTLICRYPPPLDAANSNQAAGNGLVHELGAGSADSNSRPYENSLGHQAFEFVDPASGRPTSRLGIGQQTETFGELQAPPNGRQRIQTSDSLAAGSPAERILFRQHEQLPTPPLGTKQLNSRLFLPTDTTRPLESGVQLRNNSSLSGYFDRLTSVELLFLISSLMFLVLLAFGFAGGYYCFTRRNRREPPNGAQLLGRRKRRSYFNSPTSLLTPVAADSPATRAGRTYHNFRGPHANDGGAHYASSSNRQLQPAPTQGRLLYEPDAYPGMKPGNSATYYQQYLQQAQTAPSSPDESDISGQNLLPANSTGHKLGYFTPAPVASAHYQSSTLRPHYFNHQHQQPGSTAGRRQAPEMLQQVGGRRAALHPDRPFGNATLRSSANNFQPLQQQQHIFNAGASTLGRRVNRPYADPLVNLTTGNSQSQHQHYHRSNQHNRINQEQAKQQRALPLASQTVAANLYYAQMRHARSLQQLRGEQPEAEQIDNWRYRTNQDKQQDHLNDDKIRQKQRQHFYDTSNLTRPNLGEESEKFGDDCPSSASDSEIELTNDTERPRLILKSIEDSFVTNLTEVYGQEYKKRDTTRPLSMAEWRSRQPRETRDDDEQTNDVADDHAGPDHSCQTNLRSLTELDVNFAKSMLRPALSKQPKEESKQESTLPTKGASKETRPVPGSSTMVGASSIDDLVISPEYNCGKLRLRTGDKERKDGAESPGGSSMSHESISYV